MITVDDFYKEIRECTYKGEVYSVRDNGAVMRHSRQGKRIRKYDDVWTFGKIDVKTGYCNIGIERVHRIVAFAFLGDPPTPQHVVDHIDTNRQNNRPENLRWLTRLENALNNQITRARIENICGSIEVFIKNPAILRGHEKIDPNFQWMRAVSPDEAKASFDRLAKWAKEHPAPKGEKLGEWVFQEKKNHYSKEKMLELMKEMAMINEYDSLTPNVVQVRWKTPTEFPLCPQEIKDNPLVEYKKRLLPGVVFSRNMYQEAIVLDSAFNFERDSLFVMSKSSDENAIKPWFLSKVTFKDGVFYHENIQSYFGEDGALKYFTLAQGKEWTGGDVEDDFC